MKIPYTAGTLERIDEQYFNLILYKNDNVVYKATIPQKEANLLILWVKKIQLIK
jgi:hypothetical protein